MNAAERDRLEAATQLAESMYIDALRLRNMLRRVPDNSVPIRLTPRVIAVTMAADIDRMTSQIRDVKRAIEARAHYDRQEVRNATPR